MKGIASTGAPKIHVPGWMDGWVGEWVGVKAVLRIAYSNQKMRKGEKLFYLKQVLEKNCKTDR
jgi:hypothetical protein